jgi:hypothetical protein
MQGDGGEVLFLGSVGEVTVTLGHDGLSFQPLHPVRLLPDSARVAD